MFIVSFRNRNKDFWSIMGHYFANKEVRKELPYIIDEKDKIWVIGFKNKEDLFDALFQHIFHDLSQELEADIQSDAPDLWDNFQRSLVNMIHRVQHNEAHHKFCNILHLKCEHTQQNQAIITLMQSYSNMWNTLLTSALTACIKQKSLPDNLDIPMAVIYIKSTVTGLMQTWLSQPDAFDLSETAERQIATYLNALIHAPTLLKQP